jgi:DNA helicase II / ATP-dependent DNA helicase PcrA
MLFDTAPRAQTSDSTPSPALPMLQGLNPEQHRAVTLPPEHALILAGAGSGKTRVLTTRVAWLMQTGQIGPGGVMAVTFTNKAAKEMMTRLSAMLPVNVRGMWIGTFHGLCNRFLRAHWKQANLPQSFQILDTQDQLSSIKRLLKQHGIDDERFPPKQVAWFISGAKEDGNRPKDLAAKDAETKTKIELYQLYEEQCQREGVVDFGELMLRTYELLRDNPAIREHYSRRFRHILIDEFQDTNKLQYAWVKMFSGWSPEQMRAGSYQNGSEYKNVACVFAVGDDDQSIYAFRGARVGNMQDFVREFAVTQQIKLEENYRSFGHILDSANHLIDHNTKRLGKNLRTSQGAGEPVRVMENASDFGESQWMIEEIRHLSRDQGTEPGLRMSEIAVLYRSNAQSRVIETALFNAKIPYRVYGGLRFFERAEIKHALAYLRLLENPHDNTSFLRVSNFPPRGIGARSIEQLQDAARSAGCSLHDAVSVVTGKAGTSLGAFVAKMDVMREQTAGKTLREIIELVIEHSGLIEHYKSEKEGADRIENLEELVSAAESFVTIEGFGREAVALPVDELGDWLSQSPASQGIVAEDTATTGAQALAPLPSGEGVGWGDTEPGSPDLQSGEVMSPLAAFLTHAALESGDNQAQAGKDAVQMMTVHSAKGLEFDAVFITGLEEGLFPHENSLSDHDGLEEERRLMYVAITRARKRLYLSHAQTRMLHGRTTYNIKSRFFDELPEDALKWLSPKNGGFASGMQQGWGSGSYGGGYGGGYGSGRANWSSNATNSGASYADSMRAGVPKSFEKEAPSASGASIRAGMKVFHNKFGEGKVLTVDGAGEDARAQVEFGRHGVKWLALSVAKLQPI